MDRLACIDLPAFPLQLLLRRETVWAEEPAAVVETDKPQARILWVNERARRAGVLPGMRYAAGLALCSSLCAGTVARHEIDDGVVFVADLLRRFSPEVEASADEAGVFWLNATGLQRLHPSLEACATRIRTDLEKEALLARIVVGFRRFGTYAVARSRRGPRTLVLDSPAEEEVRSRCVPLARLGIAPKARDALRALGVETVEELLRLPPDGLGRRYGAELQRLHEAARGDAPSLLCPDAAPEPLRRSMILDDPECDVRRLLFLVKRLLHALLEGLAERRLALVALTLEMRLDRGGERAELLRPARPTLDLQQLLDLALLRLDGLDPAAFRGGVVELALLAEGAPAAREQLQLFREGSRRDPAAARRAFARLRAELGDDAVVTARLRDGHLPEASFCWEPLRDPLPARPRDGDDRTLVRRFFQRALPLPRRPRHEEDGWQLRGRHDAAVECMVGPYLFSGGWWRRELRREYHFARNRNGEWLWVYFDPDRRRWFLQGRVE